MGRDKNAVEQSDAGRHLHWTVLHYNPDVVLPDVVSCLPQPGETYVDRAGWSHGRASSLVWFCRGHSRRRCVRQVAAVWTLAVLRTQNANRPWYAALHDDDRVQLRECAVGCHGVDVAGLLWERIRCTGMDGNRRHLTEATHRCQWGPLQSDW